MDHKCGKNPTPQGRVPGRDEPGKLRPGANADERYANSAPGPELMEDGAAFYGFKRENAIPQRKDTEP